MTNLKSVYRTHTCGELKKSDVSHTIKLSGWVQRKRDHGGLCFVDLRDNYGLTQIVFAEPLVHEIRKVRVESVVSVSGEVLARSPETVNPKMPTGEIEIKAATLEIQSEADVLPFQVAEEDGAPEATRLKYRFLDLRRERVHRNVLLRSAVIKTIREVMQALGFFEFQTPILTSSSPEGARDFIVPSRLFPGKFYALPQAPQQFKQLLMVSGFDRYFQIAPCFRDEDPRADRAPGEFYQLDLEMSFVEEKDVFAVVETLMSELFTKFSTWKKDEAPYVRLRYEDSIATYGTDKPDMRNPLKIENVTSVFANTEFKIFRSVLAEEGQVYAIKVESSEAPSRKYFDSLSDEFQKQNGFGVAYLVIDGTEVKGSVAKVLKPEEVEQLRATLKVSSKAVIFLGAGRGDKILSALGRLRVKLGIDFKLREENAWRLAWITDYPMYERHEETGKIEFSHNPFSMPQGGMQSLLNKSPLEIYAHQYDLVLNGYEILSGAIRNHSPEIMYKAFEIAGYSREEVDLKFGGMIRAFKFGAPPHGGCAPGIDRIIMLLAGEETLRDIYAFPKAQTGEDLLMGAPSEVSERQLIDANILLRPRIG